MSIFRERLDARRVDESGRRWLFVSYDQLTDAVGPLSRAPPRELGIVLVECPGKAARRLYHKQKLALVLTSLRHFALEQADRGAATRGEAWRMDASYRHVRRRLSGGGARASRASTRSSPASGRTARATRRARAVPTLALQGSGTAVDSIERRPGVERLAQGVEMLVERRQVEAERQEAGVDA